MMQLTKTIFSDLGTFIQKKTVENRFWAKSEILWAKKNIHQGRPGIRIGKA